MNIPSKYTAGATSLLTAGFIRPLRASVRPAFEMAITPIIGPSLLILMILVARRHDKQADAVWDFMEKLADISIFLAGDHPAWPKNRPFPSRSTTA